MRWIRRGLVWLLLFLAAGLMLSGCGTEKKAGVQVLLDGAAWDGTPIPTSTGGLRVYITVDGAALIDLPFETPRTVTVIQPGTGENTIELTGEAVSMARADCENQDCVNMGAVTRENLELRVMGGFIVCLPHKLSVEVREN